ICNDVRQQVDMPRIARRFHETVAQIIQATCERLCETTGINAVALTGGVFMNALLTELTTNRLKALGFRVYRHRQVPPNDGGLSLGQAAIAAAYLQRKHPKPVDVPAAGNHPRSSLSLATTQHEQEA